MSELIAIAYDDEFKAEEVLVTLRRLQREYLIDLDDAVIVTKDKDGKVKLRQSYNLVAAGAAGGSLWGFLIGLIFLNPILGVAVGAGSGALAGYLSDYGIDDNFIKEVGDSLQPGTSALFVLVRKSTPDRVIPEISQYGGKVLRTSLSKEQEEKLQEALRQGAREHVATGSAA